MALSDLFGRFERLKVFKGSQLWDAQQRKIRKDSKLEGRESRLMRDAQSAIRKDIKATQREIRKSDPATRLNLEQYLERLQSLQRDMRQSNKVDGVREYNRKATRLEALSDYLMHFKGRNQRQIYAERLAVNVPFGNRMFENMGGQVAVDKIVGDTWTPAIDDLINEYYEQVRAYDYERATELLARIRGMVKRVAGMYNDVPRGSTDYDRY